MAKTLVKVETQNSVATGIFGESLIERFVKFAVVKPSSVATYTKSLRQMLKYFAANNIVSPTRENLINWVEDMKAAGKSASTIQLYTAAAKIFFRWLALEGVFANVADHLKSGVKVSREHKKDAPTADQCAALVANVEVISARRQKRNTVAELRDRAILSLMTTAGLRTIEVVRANVGDVRFERGKKFLYVTGKGHDEADQKVLLANQTYRAIQAYLKVRGKVQQNAPLFSSTSNRNKAGRMTTATVSRMVKKNLRGIGLDSPRLTAHSLRHATATNLIFAGVELPKVQMILRHSQISTTMIYANAWERYNNDGEQLLADMIFGKE